jgi:cytoskeletal protein RodZ
MHTEGEEIHAEGDEARAGSTPNIVRWILAISLLAAILLLSAIWIFGAATTDDEDRVATTTDRLENADEGETTDSIVSDEEQFEFGETTPAEGAAAEGAAASQATPAPE